MFVNLPARALPGDRSSPFSPPPPACSEGLTLGAPNGMSWRKMIPSRAFFCAPPLAPGPSGNAWSLWVLSLRASGRPGPSAFLLFIFLKRLGRVSLPLLPNHPQCCPWPMGPHSAPRSGVCVLLASPPPAHPSLPTGGGWGVGGTPSVFLCSGCPNEAPQSAGGGVGGV